MKFTIKESQIKDLSKDFNHSVSALNSTVNQFSENDLLAIPFKGSWSVAQILEHLLISSKLLIKSLYAETEIANRSPDEKVIQLRDLFLNFDIKLKSSDFLRPSENKIDLKDLLASKMELFLVIQNAITDLDLNLICTSFEFPTFGFLTRFEWLSFGCFHLQRHNHQIKNILNGQLNHL